jgi:hypothetical protein
MRPGDKGTIPEEEAGAPVPAAGAMSIRERPGLTTSRTVLYLLLVFVIAVLIMAVIYVYMAGQCGVTCTYAPSAAAACTGENITITYQGGGRYPSTVTSVTAYDTDFTNNRTMGGTDGVLPVGSVLVLDGPFFSPAHIIAIAEFQDGSRMVIVDNSMKCGPGPARTSTPAPHPG